MSEETKPKAVKKEESNDPEFNAPEMLQRNGEAKRKIRYNERMEIEVIKDTKFMKKGQVLNPHVVMAEQFIKDGIAKAVK